METFLDIINSEYTYVPDAYQITSRAHNFKIHTNFFDKIKNLFYNERIYLYDTYIILKRINEEIRIPYMDICKWKYCDRKKTFTITYVTNNIYYEIQDNEIHSVEYTNVLSICFSEVETWRDFIDNFELRILKEMINIGLAYSLSDARSQF